MLRGSNPFNFFVPPTANTTPRTVAATWEGPGDFSVESLLLSHMGSGICRDYWLSPIIPNTPIRCPVVRLAGIDEVSTEVVTLPKPLGKSKEQPVSSSILLLPASEATLEATDTRWWEMPSHYQALHVQEIKLDGASWDFRICLLWQLALIILIQYDKCVKKKPLMFKKIIQ